MQVLKFGGTSVGSVENINRVKEIINDKQSKIVVLSAMSGTTNALLQIIETKDFILIASLEEKYAVVVRDLFSDKSIIQQVEKYISDVFARLKEWVLGAEKDPLFPKKVVAQGEILSTYLFHQFLNQEGIKNQLVSALDFMVKTPQLEPDIPAISKSLKAILSNNKADIIITQGFICKSSAGKIDNLDRGGSDYSASIIGAAIGAEEIQIWTDIDGFHNNDPRFVEKTRPIKQLSFDEAAELAYFGAKILHPQSVLPAQNENIQVRLKNTMNPTAHGTIIKEKSSDNGIKALAAKDGITAVKIKSARMLLAHGFLEKVFSVFANYETSIDMITTSEIAISLTIDNTKNLDKIVTEINSFAKVEVEHNQSIICVVGQNIVKDNNASKVFDLLSKLPIRMISYGGSRNNISLLMGAEHKKEALNTLNQLLFSF